MNTTRFLRRNALLAGIGSILCIGGADSPAKIICPTDGRSDLEALRSDWNAVGGDMRVGVSIVSSEVGVEQ